MSGSTQLPDPVSAPVRWGTVATHPGSVGSMHLFTIGHSTQSVGSFTHQLTEHGIATLADIRSIPGSNRNPQFHAEALAASLRAVGIAYVHLADLGGRRNRQREVDPERDAAWNNRSFRNYADYTATEGFAHGLTELLELDGPVAYMCSEALPWRCHRTIVSDNLVARGHTVTHLMGSTTREHVLGAWGPPPLVRDGVVSYPDPDGLAGVARED